MNTRLATEALVCAHCGQLGVASAGSGSANPGSAGLRSAAPAAGEPWYCCAGCRAVHAILVEAGLSEYYAFRERLGERSAPVAEPLDAQFAEVDAPAFQRLYCETVDESLDRAELDLGGLHCAACVWLVERLPRLEPGVRLARVDLGRGRVAVDFVARGPGSVPLSRVFSLLAKLGYSPRPARGLAADRERRLELRRLLLRVGVAGASAGNVMLIAFALYGGAGEVTGLPEAGTQARATLGLFRAAIWLASLPALWAGALFFRGALSSVRARMPHMDLPIALGIATAFGWGTLTLLRGEDGIYFDTITTLIFLLLIGRYLEVRHRQRASQAAELLSAVLPGQARLLSSLNSSAAPLTPIELVLPGHLVLVKSGETVPVDGVVRTGSSTLDRSLMSGESKPVPVHPGEFVPAGALNLGADLRVEVLQAGAETRVAQLLRAVERAAAERAPQLAWANRLAGRFTWLVLGAALGVFAIWAPQSLAAALAHSLAVLIVACPCALGMATPLALSAAVSQAARNGILVFGASSLERLAAPSLIVLDKTGTLTTGRLQVARRVGSEAADPFVLALEEGVHHPVGRALADYLGLEGVLPSRDVIDAREVLGSGFLARVPAGELVMGSAAFVLSRANPTPEVAAALAAASATESAVVVAVDGCANSVFFLTDDLRPDAAASLRRLAELGHQFCILSGDGAATVQHVAATLARQGGVRFECVLSGISPEQKLALVTDWAKTRPSVIMVGDGVNDAGALAAAHVGVAVGGAAEAARLSADVYLSRAGVEELAQLMLGARRTRSAIRRGVGFSLCYNAFGIGLAAAGLLSPLVAAVLMPISSLTVVSHAFRSRSFASRAPARISS